MSNNNNIETIICDKCKNRVGKLASRTYTLTLSNNNRGLKSKGLDKVTLCIPCDSSRNTSISKYLSSD
jgi:hypothetical protein